ncbi:MAG: UDP-N-acetylmuramate dehydrogenase [Phycisphaerales bacterium JB043]
MTRTLENIKIVRDAPIKTWFGVGGVADTLVIPGDTDQLREILEDHRGAPLRVLGDGANLLVDDDGIDGVVIDTRRLDGVERLEPARWRVGAGLRLAKLTVECARQGLRGVEGLAGVPASIGGALRMNAGGRYGQIADVVESVDVMDLESGTIRTLGRDEIAFGYRTSGLERHVVLGGVLRFECDEPESVRADLKRVMREKKRSQPLGERSAGCAFKNPLVDGERVSAGRLLDECGCKGLRAGGASISHDHANFVVTSPGARARDVIELLDRVGVIVHERRGVDLEREIVCWKRGQDHG